MTCWRHLENFYDVTCTQQLLQIVARNELTEFCRLFPETSRNVSSPSFEL